MAFSRRRWLVGLGGLLGAGVLWPGLSACSRREPRLPVWARGLPEVDSARNLGVEYLTGFPAERDAALLLSLLSPAGLAAFIPSPEVDRSDFTERVRRDFVDDDLLSMGGWLLSRSELRLCALATLVFEQGTGTTGVFAPVPLAEGEIVHWAAPAASFTIADGATRLECRVRSGAPIPQRVTVHLDGARVDERLVTGPDWQTVRYANPSSRGSSIHLALITSPAWRPVNDFRTIGIGIDRTWAAGG